MTAQAQAADLPAVTELDLPPKLAEIAAVDGIGIDAALKLSAAWPGVRLSVPKNMRADHAIAVAIGYRPACRLAQVYGGDDIVVPACTRLHRDRLKAKILAEYRSGRSAAELAREYGVHQFSIYRWAGEEAGKAQMDMLEES